MFFGLKVGAACVYPDEVDGEQRRNGRLLPSKLSGPESKNLPRCCPEIKRKFLIKQKCCNAKSPNKESPNEESPNDESPNEKSPDEKSPDVKSPYEESPNEKCPYEESPNEKSPPFTAPVLLDLT